MGQLRSNEEIGDLARTSGCNVFMERRWKADNGPDWRGTVSMTEVTDLWSYGIN